MMRAWTADGDWATDSLGRLLTRGEGLQTPTKQGVGRGSGRIGLDAEGGARNNGR